MKDINLWLEKSGVISEIFSFRRSALPTQSMAQSKVLVELTVINNGETRKSPRVRYCFDPNARTSVADMHAYLMKKFCDDDVNIIASTLYDPNFDAHVSVKETDLLANLQRYCVALQVDGSRRRNDSTSSGPQEAAITKPLVSNYRAFQLVAHPAEKFGRLPHKHIQQTF